MTPEQAGRLTIGRNITLQLRVTDVRSEKLVAKAGDSSGIQRK
jgi:hypothetical protein